MEPISIAIISLSVVAVILYVIAVTSLIKNQSRFKNYGSHGFWLAAIILLPVAGALAYLIYRKHLIIKPDKSSVMG
jgi:Na+-driven multidrug efflux pump